jgi:hypothetical protein
MAGSENAHGCAPNAQNDLDFDFLERYHNNGDEFLSHLVLVAGDETKEQSAVKAVDANTFTKQDENFKQTLSVRKLMKTVFWDRKGVLMVEFMQQGTKIMLKVYCETLKNCVGPWEC